MAKNKQSLQVLRGSTNKLSNIELLPGQPLYNKTNKTFYIGSDTGTLQTSGINVESADKLSTARTITLGTGASATATSFNGTQNITIPVTGVKEAYLTWGGKDISGNMSAFDACLINEVSQNAFSFLSSSAITIEYSTDGGTTWTDYGSSYSNTMSLVTEVLPDSSLYLGKHTSSGTATVNDQLRITFNKGAYFSLQKLAIFITTNGCGNCTCTLEKCLINSEPDVWTVVKENVPISGYSGWNILNQGLTYGGHQSWANSIRLTFKQGTVSETAASSLRILKIYAYSNVVYSKASNYAKTGHLYSFDANQNATFPAKVKATNGFEGSLSGNATSATKATQDENGNVIADTYATTTYVDEELTKKSNTSHNHDSVYDAKGSANSALTSAKEYTNTNALLKSGGEMTGILYTSASTPLFIGKNGKVGMRAATADKNNVGQMNISNTWYGNGNQYGAQISAYNGTTDKYNELRVSHNGVEYKSEDGVAHQVLHDGNYLSYAVPTSRTINGKSLEANITLSASDVGADAEEWTFVLADGTSVTKKVVLA